MISSPNGVNATLPVCTLDQMKRPRSRLLQKQAHPLAVPPQHLEKITATTKILYNPSSRLLTHSIHLLPSFGT